MEVSLCQFRDLPKFDRHLLIGMPEHLILKVLSYQPMDFRKSLMDEEKVQALLDHFLKNAKRAWRRHASSVRLMYRCKHCESLQPLYRR